MAAKISNWLGTRSQRSHLSAALLLMVNVLAQQPKPILLLLNRNTNRAAPSGSRELLEYDRS